MREKQKRNYGIDILRILSMLSIICLHVVNAGGGRYTNIDSYVEKTAWEIFYMIIDSSVNVFAIITGYNYIEKRDIKSKSIVNLLRTSCFYYITITGCFYFFYPGKLSIEELLNSLFPPIFGLNWYIVCYVFVFFCIPYINIFIYQIGYENLRKFIILMFVLLSIIPVFGLHDYFRTGGGYSPWWMIYCYIIGAYIKLYGITRKEIKNISYILIICLLISILYASMLDMITINHMLDKYVSPNTIIFAVYFLLLFEKVTVSEKYIKYISFFSASSFGVYIIHCNPLVMAKLISNRFIFLNDLSFVIAIPIAVICCVLIYIICSVIDSFRKRLFYLSKITNVITYLGREVDKIININY